MPCKHGVGEDVGVLFHAAAIAEVRGHGRGEAVVEEGVVKFFGEKAGLWGTDFRGGLRGPFDAVFVNETGLIVRTPAPNVAGGDEVFARHFKDAGSGEGGFGEGLDFFPKGG